MDDAHRAHDSSTPLDCRRTRLAESAIGCVEITDCGIWHVHIGALTFRLSPLAVSELLALLGRAVAEHAAKRLRAEREAESVSFVRNSRGEA